jgi:ferredoxin, 2Fe-2S
MQRPEAPPTKHEADKRIEVVFVTSDSARHVVQVESGQSLMEAAVNNDVPGIGGICGGSMICATCHVIVDTTWTAAVGPAGELEQEVLDFVATGAQPNSRLSCQISAAKPLTGVVLYVPGAIIPPTNQRADEQNLKGDTCQNSTNMP